MNIRAVKFPRPPDKENARRATAGAGILKAGGLFTTDDSDTSCKTQLLAGPRFERQVVHPHRLGPRVLAELFAEIATATGEPDVIADRVEAYAALDAAVLRAVGGDRFPPMPLELIR